MSAYRPRPGVKIQGMPLRRPLKAPGEAAAEQAAPTEPQEEVVDARTQRGLEIMRTLEALTRRSDPLSETEQPITWQFRPATKNDHAARVAEIGAASYFITDYGLTVTYSNGHTEVWNSQNGLRRDAVRHPEFGALRSGIEAYEQKIREHATSALSAHAANHLRQVHEAGLE